MCGHGSLFLARRGADAHVSVAGVLHDGGDIGKVEVDKTRAVDEVGNALHTLAKHIVRNGKGVGQRDLLLGNQLETLVGNHHERIHMLAERRDTRLGLLHALLAFKGKRLGHDTDGQDAHFFSDFGDHGRRAGTGAAAHAGRDEHHVGASERRLDVLFAFFRRALSSGRIGAGAFALGDLLADLNFMGSLRTVQSLHICIDRDELNAAHTHLDHAVDSVSAAAACTDHFDLNHVVFVILVEFKCHLIVPPTSD